ncbi:MAG: murein biosynthesis integral membrane protein MurJ [Xanthobacteraceae bacterium]
MLGRIFTVGGFTLLSRITGFARDIVLAYILGAGPIADAFFVAFRIPNHFRAIFAEGAFNAAFVPIYAEVRQQNGAERSRVFSQQVLILLLASQAVLLALAWIFTPGVIAFLAPGFVHDPGRFTLAVELTRITFPYLLLVSLVTLYGGILNALERFAAPAAAPILLNLALIMALALAGFFPGPGHAAAWGVLMAGIIEAAVVGWDVWRIGELPPLRRPHLGHDAKLFLKRFAPATLGSAQTQIALFADTIIASFLTAGALSALYYADRLNQLPIGVIGIAVGTVLLPEMANRFAAGDERGARHAQNRAVELALFLAIPCLVAFVLIPDLIMRALFMRGAFTQGDAQAAAATLAAYAIGLLPFVLMRSVTVTFQARGDTTTPVVALFFAVGVNVSLKIALMSGYAQVGLAFATSVGAWVNFVLLIALAGRRQLISVDPELRRSAAGLALAGLALAIVLWLGQRPITSLVAAWAWPRDIAALALLAVIGGLVYFSIALALFGKKWRAVLRRSRAS